VTGYSAGAKDYEAAMQTCACTMCAQVCGDPCNAFYTLSADCVACLHNSLANSKCAEGDATCRQTQACNGFVTCAYGCM
jgi:hypothetical protein